MDDDSVLIGAAKFFLVIAVVFVCAAGVIGFLLTHFGGPSPMHECLSSGRGWAIVGYHQERRYSAATKTRRTVTVTDYACLDVVR